MLKTTLAKITIAVCLCTALVSCSSVYPPNSGMVTTNSYKASNTSNSNGYDITGNNSHDSQDVTSQDNPAQVTLNGNLWDDMQNNLELPDYSDKTKVKQNIRWFAHHQTYLNKIIKQSAPYIYYIYEQTKVRNLPAELALLPIIESEYDPFAHSRVGAIGLWQIMPGTASGFGLKINWWYDGRRDLITSTRAALDYLAYLNDFFTNNWLLAIAAYDSGEGTVQNAVKFNKHRQRGTDFWALHLPRETEIYVPKLLALSAIIRDPYRYNIKLLPINDAPYLEQVNIGSQIDLNQAARLAGIPVKTMRLLNPAFRRWSTDPDGPYTLLVPANKAKEFKQKLDSLPENKRVTWRIHNIQPGETLSTIVHKYKTKLYIIKQVNHLHSNIIHPKERLLIPEHFHGSIHSPILKQKSTIAEESLPGPQRVIHLVHNGDTLWTIAEKYGVKVRELCFWNHLNNKQALTASQKILIWAPPHRRTVSTHTYYYKVTPGDSLSVIARRFGSTPKIIIRRNHIKHNIVRVGQVLVIPSIPHYIHHTHKHGHLTLPKHIRYQYHTVKKGDSLEKIAHEFHTTVKNLIKWNHLRGNYLHPGQKICIYHQTKKHHHKIIHKKRIKTKRKYLYHTFRKGDSLQKIAYEFHTTVTQIKEWNNLTKKKEPHIGQKIYVYFKT